MSDKVKIVTVIPPCDICTHIDHSPSPDPAYWDVKTVEGPWANICRAHMSWAAYKDHGGRPILGLGMGQRILREMPVR